MDSTTRLPSAVVRHADVETANAVRYMVQLCKHFQHRNPASYDTEQGRIEFPSLGVCHLQAGPERLSLSAEAPDETQCAKLQDVVASHLMRFAFRENMQINWRE